MKPIDGSIDPFVPVTSHDAHPPRSRAGGGAAGAVAPPVVGGAVSSGRGGGFAGSLTGACLSGLGVNAIEQSGHASRTRFASSSTFAFARSQLAPGSSAQILSVARRADPSARHAEVQSDAERLSSVVLTA